MNVEELLQVAEVAMSRVKDRNYGTYRLIIRKGELLCVPAANHKPDDIQIYLLSGWQLKNGLSAVQWIELGLKLSNIYKELKL